MSNGRPWTGFSWLRIGNSAGCSERAEETLDYYKIQRLLDQLRNY
jgi:hypothetical protein